MFVVETRLLEGICMYIHHIKPENAPQPPYTSSLTTPPLEASPSTQDSASASSTAKGKSKATSTTSTLSTPKVLALPSGTTKRARRHPPSAPHPHPPIAERLSIYSPALESGVLIEAVKAGMSAQEEAAAGAAGEGVEGGAGRGQGAQGAAGKGKRKVIRVRG